MKRSNLLFAMSAGVLMFTACSSEQEIPNDGILNDADKQIINISVANDNDYTRGGRPLESSAPAQSIENVKIILTETVVEEETSKEMIRWVYNDNEWDTTSKEYFENGNHKGRNKSIEIPKAEFTLATGTEYNIYAIGFSNDSEYNLTAIKSAAVGQEFDSNMLIEKSASSTMHAEEIFAGDCTVTKGADDNGVHATLILNRQVAGTFGYLDEIPFVVDDKDVPAQYLHLVASGRRDALRLGKFANKDLTHNSGAVFSVINGAQAQQVETVIYSINLKDWFKELKAGEDGTIVVKNEDGTSNWTGNGTYKKYKTGSVFAASFLHPFAKNADKNPTFKLVLSTSATYVAGSAANLKTWNVTLPSSSYQTSAYTLWSYSINNFEWTPNNSCIDTRLCYNVLRNHLYGIGARPKTYPGTDPENPDPKTPDPDDDDDDDPTPLNNKQELELRVNSCWEVVYEMGLE